MHCVTHITQKAASCTKQEQHRWSKQPYRSWERYRRELSMCVSRALYVQGLLLIEIAPFHRLLLLPLPLLLLLPLLRWSASQFEIRNVILQFTVFNIEILLKSNSNQVFYFKLLHQSTSFWKFSKNFPKCRFFKLYFMHEFLRLSEYSLSSFQNGGFWR